jgi:Ras GTPase-activating-like protein IQGAP2/3
MRPASPNKPEEGRRVIGGTLHNTHNHHGGNSTPPTSDRSRRDSIVDIVEVVKQQDQARGDLLAKNQKALYDLKREISVSSKKNFALERDIRTLDKKIALLIKNRITLEEVMASGDLMEVGTRTITLKNNKERELYGQLFYLLQRDTKYIATLARLVKVGEIDNLLQTVMFTLYGNQYEENEEHLLLSMFQAVLQAEFDEANGFGSLLRANTALTRMMSTYTRRGPGQQYLKQVLTEELKKICDDKDACLEINPIKVYEGYIIEQETKTGKVFSGNRKPTPEEAAADEQVKRLIAPRMKRLEEISQRFLDAILVSTESVPYGIRWICKQIRELTKVKFPAATRKEACSLVGGFFLLRFINPAIVTPQAFMLVDSKLSANTRRNLTLLAKMLQNLANNVQFGGVKEFYMEPLNVFLDRNRDRLNDFLEGLTRVEDLNTHLLLDKYLALGKTTDVTINISLNEMYFIHGLLVQHIDALVPSTANAEETLRPILTDLGTPPQQVPRPDNANVELKLSNRFENEPGGALNMRPERMYNETKYLLFYVLKFLPKITVFDDGNLKGQIDAIAAFALQTKDADLLDKTKKIQHNCKKLVQDGMLADDDNYSSLRKDIIQELLNYELHIAKSATDLDKLKQVRAAIGEHNVFLQQQLSSYEQYLVNVKANVSTASLSSLQSSASIGGKDKEKIIKPEASKVSKKDNKKKSSHKFSHSQLEKDGVIVSSEVPEDKRSNIFFSFSSAVPGEYDVLVMYKSRIINEIRLQLDVLLEKQHNNNVELETDFLKLNVNLLIYLLNKTFIS